MLRAVWVVAGVVAQPSRSPVSEEEDRSLLVGLSVCLSLVESAAACRVSWMCLSVCPAAERA